MSRLPELTYPHDCVCQLAEILGLDEISQLKISMNEEHVPLFNRLNRVPVLTEYFKNTKHPDIKAILRTRLNDPDAIKLITNTLNEPTLEAFLVLEQAGLPQANSVIFNTTATANSGNDNAVMAAFKILGLENADCNIVFENCSTCAKSGYTGVSYTKPKHIPVSFDPHKPPDQWSNLALDLGKQLYTISTGEQYDGVLHDKYTNIYHWGCISQNWLKGPTGHFVSSWKLHEQWNLLFTMGMMWHAVATLHQGGQLCLKVRIMRRAETLGLVSLLSALFDSTQILDNARQQCSFGIAIFSGFNASNELRKEMLDILTKCMNFEPSSIFFNRIQYQYPKCRETMLQCESIRKIMTEKRAETDTVFIACLHCLKVFLQHKNKRIMYDTALPLLTKVYGDNQGRFLLDSLMIAAKRLTHEQKQMLMLVMDTKWMHDNV